MQFSTFFVSAAVLLMGTSGSPTPEVELVERQSNFDTIDTSALYLGACLSVGSCYYTGSTTGCMTHGCNDTMKLGSVCSCNKDVQLALDIQMVKGRNMWPIKCAMTKA
ncbi:hypothetical protein BGZ60DRAFT_525583 [Tricladium varicosporioides]|nr:hypothetical protein BGZ60DRAFT_525583 [Hymenoscyphus varicosporioides]